MLLLSLGQRTHAIVVFQWVHYYVLAPAGGWAPTQSSCLIEAYSRKFMCIFIVSITTWVFVYISSNEYELTGIVRVNSLLYLHAPVSKLLLLRCLVPVDRLRMEGRNAMYMVCVTGSLYGMLKFFQPVFKIVLSLGLVFELSHTVSIVACMKESSHKLFAVGYCHYCAVKYISLQMVSCRNFTLLTLIMSHDVVSYVREHV